jgi:hypothetical protein
MATSCYKVGVQGTKASPALYRLEPVLSSRPHAHFPAPWNILSNITLRSQLVIVAAVAAAAQIVGFAGYSSYLTALSYAVYLLLGGVPAGQSGYDAGALPGTLFVFAACVHKHVYVRSGGPLSLYAGASAAASCVAQCKAVCTQACGKVSSRLRHTLWVAVQVTLPLTHTHAPCTTCQHLFFYAFCRLCH